MNIITTPVAEVVALSKFVGSSTFYIPPDGDDHTKIGSFAAKVCYDSMGVDGRSNEANQLAILEHRHGSVLEHSTVSLYITGITRGLSLELNRHRSFAVSQRSTRYTAEESASLVLDPFYSMLYEKYKIYITDITVDDITLIENFNLDEYNLIVHHLTSAAASFDAYHAEVDSLMALNPNKLTGFDLRKWARGKARNLLPHGLETRGVWTNNHRGWRWFIEARSDIHAEPEIRRLAHIVWLQLKSVAPLYYNDFQIVDMYDSIPHILPTYKKV